MLLIKGAFSKDRFVIKIFLFFCLSLFGLLMGGLLSVLLFGKLQGINDLRWSQFIMSVACFAIPGFVSAFLFHPKGALYLRADKRPSLFFALLAIAVMLFSQPFVNLVSEWNQHLQLPENMAGLYQSMQNMERTAADLTQKFLMDKSLSALFINIFFLSLIPAITEEVFFRGALLRILEEKLNVHWCVWIVAVVFSTYHMQFFGFVPRVLLGALLGYIAVWSGSIYASMLAHFINNAGLVFFNYLSANHYISFDVEAFGVAPRAWWLTFSALLVVLLLLYLMYKKSGYQKLPSDVF